MKNETCKGCKCFHRIGTGGEGQCVRFPRPVNKSSSDWCGEYRADTSEKKGSTASRPVSRVPVLPLRSSR